MLAAGVLGASALFGVLSLRSDDGDPGHPSGAAAIADGTGVEPPEAEEEIFEDDFDDETSGWKTAAAPVWDASYRDRKYELHVLASSKRTVADAPVEDVPASQLMEVEVEHTGGQGGEAGLYCHGQGDGYAFLLRDDGRARIARIDGSTLTDLATGTATDLDDDTRLQAACVEDGSRLSLGMWVDGEHVASTAAEAPDGDAEPSGLIAYRPDGATGDPEATFDDFALCSV
ncbi:hypothetical protein E1200_30190 [Actinomadura sp. GC306]|nr:hypothetical protein E1200_30190 [Actinomadura sp. GC306]